LRVYESIYILQPDLGDEDVDGLVSRINKIVEDNGGKILDIEKWGKRRLAYEVARERYGIYIFFRFEAEAEAVKELERNYRLIGEVKKYIVIRLDKKELARLEVEKKKQTEAKAAEAVEEEKKKQTEEKVAETVKVEEKKQTEEKVAETVKVEEKKQTEEKVAETVEEEEKKEEETKTETDEQ